MAQSHGDEVLSAAVDWSPFEKNEVYKLGLVENWPLLRQILATVTSSSKFAVTDPTSQAVVDEARLALDSSWGKVHVKGILAGNCYYVVQIVVAHEGNDQAVQVMELLLAAGVNPDKTAAAYGRRPSHLCAWLGRLDVASSLFLCRPDMTVKNNYGDSTRRATERTYRTDIHFPARKALRPYLATFLTESDFESGFPTLAELALQKKWFAVKNLIRREVVPRSEFTQSFKGRTAAEWAKHFGETMLSQEIEYYGKFGQKINDIVSKKDFNFCSDAALVAATLKALLSTKWRAPHLWVLRAQPFATRLSKAVKEVLQVKAEMLELEEKVKQMEQEFVEKDSRIKDLAEAVETLSAKVETIDENAAVAAVETAAVPSQSTGDKGSQGLNHLDHHAEGNGKAKGRRRKKSSKGQKGGMSRKQ